MEIPNFDDKGGVCWFFPKQIKAMKMKINELSIICVGGIEKISIHNSYSSEQLFDGYITLLKDNNIKFFRVDNSIITLDELYSLEKTDTRLVCRYGPNAFITIDGDKEYINKQYRKIIDLMM